MCRPSQTLQEFSLKPDFPQYPIESGQDHSISRLPKLPVDITVDLSDLKNPSRRFSSEVHQKFNQGQFCGSRRSCNIFEA